MVGPLHFYDHLIQFPQLVSFDRSLYIDPIGFVSLENHNQYTES